MPVLFCVQLRSTTMRVLNAAQMREADRRTIEDIGIPSLVLMENAGRQVVAAMEAVHGDLLERRVAVLCGRGNNGGDGFVVARTLLQRGVDVSVFLIGRVADVRGDARTNLEILGRLGPHRRRDRRQPGVGAALLRGQRLHADRRRDLRHRAQRAAAGLLETVVADVNASGIPVVADRSAVRACRPTRTSRSATRSRPDMTVTLAAPKLPLVLPPAETRAGDIVIADIGIPAEVIERVDGPRVELLTRAAMRELIAPRSADSHKGDYGRVLIVAGSRGKTGAAHLAAIGRAALGRRARHGRDAGRAASRSWPRWRPST